MVYLSKMVIFHGYVSHNQMVKEIPRFGAGYQFKSATSHPIGHQGEQQRPDNARGEGHTEPANSWLVESAMGGFCFVFLEMGKMDFNSCHILLYFTFVFIY
jgi:hypothetical protein